MPVNLEKKIIETCIFPEAANTRITPDANVIVPDSKPDAAKVVSAAVRPLIAEKRVQKDYITLSGNLDYEILYLTEEKDIAPRLMSISTRMPFSHQIEVTGGGDDICAGVKANVVSVSAEAVNSRKLNIKSVVDFETNLVDSSRFEAVVSSAESSIPCRSISVPCSSVAAFCENEFELGGVLATTGGSIIEEILCTDIKIDNREVRCLNGKLAAKGVARVSALYMDSDGVPRTVEGDIPFTEVLSIDGVDDSMIYEVDYSFVDTEFTAASDDDGDTTAIDIKVTVSACGYVYSRVNEEVATDLYSPEFELDVTDSVADVCHITYNGSEQCSIRESITLAPYPDATSIYNTTVNPCITDIKTSPSGAEVVGVADVCITCISDSEAMPVYTCRREVPFNCNLSTGSSDPDGRINVLCEAENIVCSLSAPSSAELRFNLYFETKVTETKEISYVADVKIPEGGETDKGDMPSIVIYFASKGERLWDIAKKYRTTAERLATANGIEFGEVLDRDMQIMIPKK